MDASADQRRVLVWLSLQDVLREGVDPVTGARLAPIRHLVFSMGMIGLLIGLGAGRHASLDSFAIHVAAVAMWLTAMLVLPDPLDVREKKLELLRSRPVPPAIMVQARILSLLGVTALAVSCLVAVPIVLGLRAFGAGVVVGLALWMALVAAAFAAVLTWLGAALVLARRFGVARVRSFSQLVLALSIIVVMGLSVLGPAVAGEIGRVSWVGWLPSTWFARLALQPSLAGALLPVGLIAGALALHLRLDVDRCYETAERADERVSRFTLTAVAGRAGRAVLPAPAAAIADLTLRVGSREDISRVRLLAPRLVQLAMFAVALSSADPTFPLAMLAGYAFFCVADGLNAASRTSHPEASWLLFAAPVPPRLGVLGLAWAVLARDALMPAVLVAIVAARNRPPLAAALLAAAFVLVCAGVVAFLLAIAPRHPLASEQRVWPGLGGLLGLNLLGMSAAVVYVVLVVLTGMGPIGTLVATALSVPLLLVVAALVWIAGRRVPSAEFTY